MHDENASLKNQLSWHIRTQSQRIYIFLDFNTLNYCMLLKVYIKLLNFIPWVLFFFRYSPRTFLTNLFWYFGKFISQKLLPSKFSTEIILCCDLFPCFVGYTHLYINQYIGADEWDIMLNSRTLVLC